MIARGRNRTVSAMRIARVRFFPSSSSHAAQAISAAGSGSRRRYGSIVVRYAGVGHRAEGRSGHSDLARRVHPTGSRPAEVNVMPTCAPSAPPGSVGVVC
jgi:hypothetical protein